MKKKIFNLSIICLIFFSTILFFALFANAEENEPIWPNSWLLIDTDPFESSSHDFRDVKFAYYNIDIDYLYFINLTNPSILLYDFQ